MFDIFPCTRPATIGERKVVTLTYASPSALHHRPATGVFDLDMTVQVRHKHGVIVADVRIAAAYDDLATELHRHLPSRKVTRFLVYGNSEKRKTNA